MSHRAVRAHVTFEIDGSGFAPSLPRTGFEPARLSALPPQSSASANSATWASGNQLTGQIIRPAPTLSRPTEAEVGFEPTNNGFAIRPLSPLGYSANLHPTISPPATRGKLLAWPR